MTKQVDQAFLREVQRRGWQIESATPTGCIARCPTPGCGMRAKLVENTTIPPRVVSSFDPLIPIRDWPHMREVMRDRRQELRLSIADLEHCAGLTADHIAKAETGARNVNLDTIIAWAGAEGYEIVLRPIELPAITLRVLAETRLRDASRGRRFDRERDGRETPDARRSLPGLPPPQQGRP